MCEVAQVFRETRPVLFSLKKENQQAHDQRMDELVIEVTSHREILMVPPHLERIHDHLSMIILITKIVKIHVDHHHQLFLLRRQLEVAPKILQMHAHKVSIRGVVHAHRDHAHNKVNVKVIVHLFRALEVIIVTIDKEQALQATVLNQAIHPRKNPFSIRNLIHTRLHIKMHHIEPRNQNTEQRNQKKG